MNRITKSSYYLKIAEAVASRGTCLRRNFGAVIVKNDQIISTGYTGAPSGTINCCDINQCYRDALGIPPGKRYDLCRSVHAEMNAIIQAPRSEMIGAKIYIVGIDTKTGKILTDVKHPCCHLCKRLVINAGIEEAVIGLGMGKNISEPVIFWVSNNLDDFKKEGDKLVPNISEGY